MRTPASVLLASAIGLAASLAVCTANAGGAYVGVAVPVAVTAPPVPVLAPVAVEYDPTVVIGPDYYCCGPGWHGRDWHGYDWHGYRERGYVRPAPAARAEVRRGRR
jgi:hypothetical protein